MNNIFLYKNLNKKNIIYIILKLNKKLYKKFIKKVIFFYYNILIKKIYNFFVRIKHYGKSYTLKLKKKKKTLICNFGQSHMTNIKYKNIYLLKAKKRRKTFFIKFKYLKTFIKLKKLIKSIRPINHYTKRGLRLGNYKYIKRYGKISQAFSKLH